MEYIFCVLLAGKPDNCEIDVEKPSFAILILLWISISSFPIVTFTVFGLRKDIFLFWKEYFYYCYKNKTVTLSFIPSFDPGSTQTTIIE